MCLVSHFPVLLFLNFPYNFLIYGFQITLRFLHKIFGLVSQLPDPELQAEGCTFFGLSGFIGVLYSSRGLRTVADFNFPITL
jgi:hypothetical protein